MEKSSAEISVEIDELEKELSKALKNLEIVENQEIELSKEILKRRLEKKDIEVAVSKAKYVVRELHLRISQAKKAFWSAKNSGL